MRFSPASTTRSLLAACLLGIAAAACAQANPDPTTPAATPFEQLVHDGFALHQQARFTESIPLFQRALRQQPTDYFANLLLGIDLLRVSRPQQALPHLEAAARQRPSELIPQQYLGETQASLAHYGPAALAYQHAVQLSRNSSDPSDQEAALLSWASFAIERFRQIESTLRATTQGEAVARAIQQSAGQPLPPSARQCAAQLPSLERQLALPTPPLPATTTQLALCYAAQAGFAAADLATSSQNHDQAAIHRLRGDVLLRIKEDPQAAIAEFQQSLTQRPGDPAILERLAEAQWTAGDADSARASAQSALLADPHRQAAIRTLAAIAVSTRDYPTAIPLLRQLAAEAPGDRLAPVELGRALAQTGQEAEASALLAPALAAGYPDEKGALHALLARCLRRTGRPQEAEAAESEARRLSDDFQRRSAAPATAPPASPVAEAPK